MKQIEMLLVQAKTVVEDAFQQGFREGYEAVYRFYTQSNKQAWESPQPQVGYPEMFGGNTPNLNDYGIYETPAKPEQWITEFRTKNTEKDWQRSADDGLKEVFTSEKEAQASVDADAEECITIVRRVRRID